MANDMNQNKKGRKASKQFMSVQEAGRKGGQTTASTHDSDFYSNIGRMGGQERARRLKTRKKDINK
ncbi:MAG TPA: Em GEA1 (EM1) [Patescibacteria group bacterium]